MIRASIPKLMLDDAFEQKNEIAKAVEEELEKVTILAINYVCFCFFSGFWNMIDD